MVYNVVVPCGPNLPIQMANLEINNKPEWYVLLKNELIDGIIQALCKISNRVITNTNIIRFLSVYIFSLITHNTLAKEVNQVTYEPSFHLQKSCIVENICCKSVDWELCCVCKVSINLYQAITQSTVLCYNNKIYHHCTNAETYDNIFKRIKHLFCISTYYVSDVVQMPI